MKAFKLLSYLLVLSLTSNVYSEDAARFPRLRAAGERIGETASYVGERVGETAREVAGNVRETASNVGERISEVDEEIGEFWEKPRCKVRRNIRLAIEDIKSDLTERFTSLSPEAQRPLVNWAKKHSGVFKPKLEKMLNLSNCAITSVDQIEEIADALDIDLTKVTKLNLARNYLTEIPANFFTKEKFPALNTLILGSNCIESIAPRAINLPELQVLFLADNLLHEIPTNAIMNCPKLALVTVGKNNLGVPNRGLPLQVRRELGKAYAQKLEDAINAQSGRKTEVNVVNVGINRVFITDMIKVAVVVAIAVALAVAFGVIGGGAAVVGGAEAGTAAAGTGMTIAEQAAAVGAETQTVAAIPGAGAAMFAPGSGSNVIAAATALLGF